MMEFYSFSFSFNQYEPLFQFFEQEAKNLENQGNRSIPHIIRYYSS